MRPYPRYKPTGLAWLPSVPEHWEVVKNRSFLRESCVLLPETKAQLLSVSQYDGVTPFPEDRKERVETLEGYKVVDKNDLVMNIMLAWNGSSGVSAHQGVVSPAYAVFKILDGANPRFIHYLFRSDCICDYFKAFSTGVVDSRLRLYPQVLARMWSPLPPPSEQDRIVRYLDEKTAAIDELVRAKERQIELLRERKQALVSAAVTGGLDPATERKDSGVPWIGKIPKGWKVCRLKDIVRSNLESLGEATESDKQIKYLDISAVGNGYLREKPVCMVFAEAPSRARRIVHEGDTIISTVRTYLKSVLYIDQSVSDCIVSTGFSVLTPKTEIEPRYLGFLLSSNWFVDSVIAQSIGISYPAINDSSLLALSVVFPPLPEQQRIVAHLDSVCSELDAAEAAIRKQIALLQELRTRLVSDAVTGAVEV